MKIDNRQNKNLDQSTVLLLLSYIYQYFENNTFDSDLFEKPDSDTLGAD